MLKLPTHDRYAYSPIEARPQFSWPDQKRLAFYIGLNVEHFAFLSGLGSDPFGRASARQTQRNFAWRDYGLRVGIWRVFRMLDRAQSAGYDFAEQPCVRELSGGDRADQAAGRRGVRSWPDQLGEPRRHVGARRGTHHRRNDGDDRAAFRHAAQRDGWGLQRPSSGRTPDLLVEAGYTHSLGWPVDDQPIWMRTRSGPLLIVPYPMELNDIGANIHRDHSGREFADMIVDQFEEMIEQSEQQPLVMSVALHPFICGQPFRLRPLRQALTALRRTQAQRRRLVYLCRTNRRILHHPPGLSGLWRPEDWWLIFDHCSHVAAFFLA